MRKKTGIFVWAMLLLVGELSAQEIPLTEYAPLDEVAGEVCESDDLLPMNELGMESGYLLYETEIESTGMAAELEIEHVRDYASVFVDGRLVGTLTDGGNRIDIEAPAGRHTLRLYVENIGRITYGPEILDNSRGLFGEARLGGEVLLGWRIVPLGIREGDPASLIYRPLGTEPVEPGFRRGRFDAAEPAAAYLDVSGWGMGEVWINGCYLGSFWDEERQQSIRIPDGLLRPKENTLVVFDLKNVDPTTGMHLSNEPVFN